MRIFDTINLLGGSGSVAGGLAILALAVTVGLSIGAIPFRGLKLGISGVLFSSLIFRQIGFDIDTKVLDFLRDFALIIFMYAIGLQVGPGFVASLRAEGFRYNILSICVLLLGGLLAAAMIPLLAKGGAPGLYCGAFTTTPGLAAAQEALRAAPKEDDGQSMSARANLAYSITYPFGVVGPMLVVAALRSLFRVRMDDERAAFAKIAENNHSSIEIADIEVTIETCGGKQLRDYPQARDQNITFTRLLRDGMVSVPTADTVMKLGDRFRAIGPRDKLDELITSLGRRSDADLSAAPGDVDRMELVV
ncbi:MAG TPA: hypothetical protein VHS31_12645, partial [Tepidisphaeraceae bacterium]|nr:hypothetical protein [Tepidisphaeraceae bacterium]